VDYDTHKEVKEVKLAKVSANRTVSGGDTNVLDNNNTRITNRANLEAKIPSFFYIAD